LQAQSPAAVLLAGECEFAVQGSQAELLPEAALYVPAGHAVHCPAPAAGLLSPGAHAVHSEPSGPVYPGTHVQLSSVGLDACDCVWLGHVSHIMAFSEEYSPSAQTPHAASPVSALNWQAWHALHALPSSPVVLGLHLHDSSVALPAGLLPESAGHEEHPAEPVNILYVPASHALHTSPSFPVCPGLQTHEAIPTLPALMLSVLVGQGEQEVVSSCPPVASPYLPAMQAMHAPDPGSGWYFPGSHNVQALASELIRLPLYLPAAHWSHAPLPGPSLYVPVAHARHVASANSV